jgi:predicted Zn finger-like uncharacterized protein
MDITCSQCQSQFKIDKAKLPRGQAAALRCPTCATRIVINGAPAAPSAAPSQEQISLKEVDTSAYNPADRPFDFIEEEGKTALVCESDLILNKHVIDALRAMEYQITPAGNARDALKRMRYHVYDIVVVDEGFDTENAETNGVLIYLERLSMAARRNTFVVMISHRYRTMDNMSALLKSVNLIVNVKNIDDFGKIVSRGLTDHMVFYRVFQEKLKETGKA